MSRTSRDAGPSPDKRRDDAARAAWLYFIGGRTQDEIATQLDLSRQVVQRLVSFATAERLIKFRLDHPIRRCMELAEQMRDRFDLEFCDVAPTDASAPDGNLGVAIATAERLGRLLSSKAPMTIGVGTGRTLRAAVEQLEEIERPQHKIVSLVGNITAAGHASPYDVVMRLGDKLNAQRFPLPAPVVADSAADRKALQSLKAFHTLRDLRETARAIYVGIGEISWGAPLRQDGFMTDADITELVEAGAVGEITGWPFDNEGKLIEGDVAHRVASLPLETPPKRQTVIVGCGAKKVAPMAAALRGGLATALITDEKTAEAVLAMAG